MKAISFEILRNVEANGRVQLPLARQPKKVCTLIDEQAFLVDHQLVHHKTVFFEDRFHDWDWRDGKFTYYTRVAEKADVLVVYEIEG